MADAFAPQFQGEVRFNQPIEQPSALGAVADLVGMFGRSFSQAQESRASTAPKVDQNLGVFRQGLERVEAIRQERGETAALVAERQLASNFAMAGINLDDDYKDVYEKTTGRTWAGYGADNEARIMEETLKDPQVQASYVASFAVNKDWTEEQRIEYAIGQKATLQAAENEIARSKAEAGYKWSVQTEAAYSTAIDTFININLGGLQTLVEQGGRVTPQDIANLTAQWAQLKAGSKGQSSLSRPSGVSDEQWKAVQDKISNVDKMLETFQKATSSEVLLETLTTGIAQDMLKQGGGSVESRLAGVISIKDPASLNGLVGGVSEFIMGASGSLNLNVPTPDLFGHILENQGGLAAETDPNAIITSIPDNMKKELEGKTPEQIYKGLEAAGLLTSVVGPTDLSRPEARQQFVENATTIGAVLMNNPSDQFLSDAALKKLVANPQFIRNILALETTDPEAYTVARQFVRGGLSTELARQQRNLAAIENQMAITWDGSKYTFNKEALMAKGYSEKRVDEFIAWFNSPVGYSGDIQALANFNRPIPEGMLVVSPVDINQAIDRRNAISTIEKSLKALEVEVEAPAGQDPTAAVATTGSVTAETPSTYFDVNEQNLPAGGSIVEVGSAKVVANNTMKPLLNSTVGASSLVKPGADTRIAGVLQGPFQTLQNTFGAALVINDGLAKEGTSREKETPGSRHFHGDALDISTAGMSDADKLRLVDAALSAGFQGFGFGNNILHVDLGSKRAWAYGNDSFGGMSVADLKARVQGNATAPAAISMDPRVAQPSAGGNLATPEADDKEGAATGFTLLDGSFSVSGGGATTEAPATATEAATAELPVDFSNAATGVMPQQEEQAQAPVVDAEVAALIDNLSTKTKRQLKAAGIEPTSLKFFETDAAAEAAIESGELKEGDAYILPNGQVNIVEGD